ncbi:hypothetical protein [Lentzea sp. NPDC092896]|uniref:hypothetical protein n=1 Tax=Lentzea sp. NPDC092896 TaxID=3364127 RepID=UPI00381F71D7
MIKMEKFLISKGPYAVDLGSLRTTQHGREDGSFYWGARVSGAWFRRRRGVTVACIGYLWDYQDNEPADALAFLAAHDDGRYGGTTLGRWDGSGFWGDVSLEEQEKHLAILRPMLANYPAVPAGFDGWWKF